MPGAPISSSPPPLPAAARVLIISSRHADYADAIRRVFEAGPVALAASRSDARRILNRGVEVVFTDSVLPDGDWRGVAEDLQSLARPPALVVLTRAADPVLWAEVFSAGGLDMLLTPVVESELRWIAGLTARHHRDAGRKPPMIRRGAAQAPPVRSTAA